MRLARDTDETEGALRVLAEAIILARMYFTRQESSGSKSRSRIRR